MRQRVARRILELECYSRCHKSVKSRYQTIIGPQTKHCSCMSDSRREGAGNINISCWTDCDCLHMGDKHEALRLRWPARGGWLDRVQTSHAGPRVGQLLFYYQTSQIYRIETFAHNLVVSSYITKSFSLNNGINNQQLIQKQCLTKYVVQQQKHLLFVSQKYIFEILILLNPPLVRSGLRDSLKQASISIFGHRAVQTH